MTQTSFAETLRRGTPASGSFPVISTRTCVPVEEGWEGEVEFRILNCRYICMDPVFALKGLTRLGPVKASWDSQSDALLTHRVGKSSLPEISV